MPAAPLLHTALAKRDALQAPDTNLLRLIDGAADGFPGHYLESYGPHWLLATTGQRRDAELCAELARHGKSLYWKRLDQHQKDSPLPLHGPETPARVTGLENGVSYHLSFHSGYSQGIFLDQRDNRRQLRELLAPGQTLLNTFAYTGAFSVCGALAGATTTTLDLSQPYLDWAKDNFTLNQLDPAAHYFCKGDTFHWLRRFAKQGRRFHAIVLDPPTFSRDQKGKVFRVEKDYAELVALALRCLEKDGTILASTNCKKLSLRDFKTQLAPALPRAHHLHAAPMPEDFPDTPYLKSLWIKA
ncbi:MAG: class I SAM-dependent rRNA methyltransferase [Verrucomicrobiales bacterium]